MASNWNLKAVLEGFSEAGSKNDIRPAPVLTTTPPPVEPATYEL